MSLSRLIDRWGRLLFAAVALVSSFYCLLAFVPFTYFHFLQFSHLSWLDGFVRWHAFWFAGAFALAAVASRPASSGAASRAWIALLVLGGAQSLALFAWPVLPNLQNDTAAYGWSLLFLLPPAAFGVVDLMAARARARTRSRADHRQSRLFLAATGTAVLATAVGFGAGSLGGFRAVAGESERLLALGISLTAHLTLFLGLFLVLGLIERLAGLFPRRRIAEQLLFPISGAVLFALVFRGLCLEAISFTGGRADFYALAVGGSLVCFLLGAGRRLPATADGGLSGGLESLLRPLAPGAGASRFVSILWGILVCGTVAWGLSVVGPVDWDFRGQQILAALLWLLLFALLFLRLPAVRISRFVLLLAPLAAALLFRGADLLEPQVRLTLLRSYAGYDASYRLAADALLPRREDDLYRFLQRNTNIPRAVHVEPVDLELVADLEPVATTRPDIYFFTVDSLRRDYLSPYDRSVDFTPEIERFAADSIVFRNAFTHYGATGLSEPAIWVGGLLLHKQYVIPFHPMNTLQKLLEAEGYELHVTMDTILTQVLRPSPSVVELRVPGGRKFPMCESLQAIRANLASRPPDGPPIFSYVQPQDIHISVINREARSVPGAGEYEGFFAPYAARVRRMDRCLGEFLDYLKRENLYERSIIVLTSDHGDSLGEEGRWGHAYTVFPEVIEVPLIVRLPDAMRDGLEWDEGDIAFASDITPSLHYLLGHRPLVYDPVLGRPLFAETLAEARSYLRESYLVASSYGPVYGVLSDNGRRLFIADGVNFQDYLFELGPALPTRPLPISPGTRARAYGRIREQIEAIHRLYRHPTVP